MQGDALGGGFEIALAGNILVAERGAKMGFPEVLFNLFPGMGAYNAFLSRRIGMYRTEQMLLNGKLYRAEELHAEGVVDILAEDGRGENAVYEYIVRNENRRNAREAIHRVQRRLFPLRYEEFLDVADIWVDTAMQVGPREIRMMEQWPGGPRASSRGVVRYRWFPGSKRLSHGGLTIWMFVCVSQRKFLLHSLNKLPGSISSVSDAEK